MSMSNFVNRENLVPSNQAMAGKDLTNSIRKPFRSQAFGELKNVMHNQNASTPFKYGGGLGLTSSARKDPISLKYKMTPSKENMPCLQNLNKKKLDLNDGAQIKTIVEVAEDDIETHSKCSEKCEKSLDYIWSEMSVLSPDIIEKICDSANNKDLNEDEQINDDYDADFYETTLLENMKQKLIINTNDQSSKFEPAPLGTETLPKSDFWDDYLNY